MTTTSPTRPGGWGLTLACAALIVATSAAIYLAYDSPTDGMRRVIRVTAHTSLVLFLAAFTASALVTLWRSAATRWLRRNRRQFGVSFALSHMVHGVAIIALASRDPDLFWQLTSIGNIVAGGTAYLFILAMFATSFATTARLIGPRAWAVLHAAGVWYIWIVFMVANGKRLPQGVGYAVPVALLLTAAALKLAAVMYVRSQRRVPSLQST